MNVTFLSALRAHGGPGTDIRTASGTIPARARPPADGTIATLFGITSPEVKPLPVRVASAAPSSSTVGAFFGNLFGSKRDNTNANVLEVTQPIQTKSRAVASATPVQTKAIAITRPTPDVQHATNPQASPQQQEPRAAPPLPNAEGVGTTVLLKGAAPTLPVGGFEHQFSAR